MFDIRKDGERMSILPSFLHSTAEIETIEAVSSVVEIPREYGIDFSTGELTGKIVEGLETIKVWVWNCMHTERFRHAIYSWDYGCSYEQYIGETVTQEYLETDCYSETEEALLVNPYITGIDDFTTEITRDKLHVSFRVLTKLGDVEVSMDV